MRQGYAPQYLNSPKNDLHSLVLRHDADAAVAFAHGVRIAAALRGDDVCAAAQEREQEQREPHCSVRAKVRPRSSLLAPACFSSATSAEISASTSI